MYGVGGGVDAAIIHMVLSATDRTTDNKNSIQKFQIAAHNQGKAFLKIVAFTGLLSSPYMRREVGLQSSLD